MTLKSNVGRGGFCKTMYFEKIKYAPIEFLEEYPRFELTKYCVLRGLESILFFSHITKYYVLRGIFNPKHEYRSRNSIGFEKNLKVVEIICRQERFS